MCTQPLQPAGNRLGVNQCSRGCILCFDDEAKCFASSLHSITGLKISNKLAAPPPAPIMTTDCTQFLLLSIMHPVSHREKPNSRRCWSRGGSISTHRG